MAQFILDKQPTFLSLIEKLSPLPVSVGSATSSDLKHILSDSSLSLEVLKNNIKNITISRYDISYTGLTGNFSKYKYCKKQSVYNFWGIPKSASEIFIKAIGAKLKGTDYQFTQDVYFQLENQEHLKLTSVMSLFTLLNYYGERLDKLSVELEYQELLKSTADFAQTNVFTSLVFQVLSRHMSNRWGPASVDNRFTEKTLSSNEQEGVSWEIEAKNFEYERNILCGLSKNIQEEDLQICQQAIQKEIQEIYELFFHFSFNSTPHKLQLNFLDLRAGENLSWTEVVAQTQIKIIQDLSLTIQTFAQLFSINNIYEKQILDLFLTEFLILQNKIMLNCDIKYVDYFSSLNYKTKLQHYGKHYEIFLEKAASSYDQVETLLNKMLYPVLVLEENIEKLKANESFFNFSTLSKEVERQHEKQKEYEEKFYDSFDKKEEFWTQLKLLPYFIGQEIKQTYRKYQLEKMKKKFKPSTIAEFLQPLKSDTNNRFFLENYLPSFIYFIDNFDKSIQFELGDILKSELESKELNLLLNLDKITENDYVDYLILALSNREKKWNEDLIVYIRRAQTVFKPNRNIKILQEKLTIEAELYRLGVRQEVENKEQNMSTKEIKDIEPSLVRKKRVNKI